MCLRNKSHLEFISSLHIQIEIYSQNDFQNYKLKKLLGSCGSENNLKISRNRGPLVSKDRQRDGQAKKQQSSTNICCWDPNGH